MKRYIFLAAATMLLATSAFAQEEKSEIVKKGYSFGPLPAVSYDEDKGFQYGALLQIFNYGDGSYYPMYKSKWYLEASAFTKGSQQYNIMYDVPDLFEGIRFCFSLKYNRDSAYDFFGYNGYNTFYDATGSTYAGILNVPASDASFSTFYKIKRNTMTARVDFIGDITSHLHWMAGYHLKDFKIGTVDFDNINKGKDEAKQYTYGKTLYDYYTEWGIIPEDQKDGGLYSCLRVGLEYDSRDKEGAPTRGIWADAHINYSPKWLGSSVSTARYSLTWRQYFPLIGHDKLTFAYRLIYEGTIGNSCPFYLLPFVSVIGVDNDVDGMGGSKTCRGITRGRITGLDVALYTAELRWRFVQFKLFNQNIAFALSGFSDGTMATRQLKTEFNYSGSGTAEDQALSKALYDEFVTNEKDTPHISVGGGLRFIMNENFIIACDYGKPISAFYPDSNPHKGQDGTGALYIGLNYLF